MKKILIFKSKHNEQNPLKEMLEHYSKEDDIEITINYYSDLKIKIDLNNHQNPIQITANDVRIEEFDLVYFRSWLSKSFIALTVAQYLKFKRLKFLDKNIGEITVGGKLLQLMIMAINNIPVPKTIFLSNDLVDNSYSYLKGELGETFIAKDREGRKGDMNFHIKNEQEFRENVVNNLSSVNYIFQEYIPNDFDYRFLVLGGKVATAEKRIRVSDPYLNNASKGGREEFFDPNILPEFSALSEKVSKLLDIEVSGVDIIVSKENSKPYILEVNPAPGFTYDYNAPEVEAFYSYLKSLV